MSKTAVSRFRKTIQHPVELSGRGIHSGLKTTVRLLPAPAGSGRMFRRADLSDRPEIPANLSYIADNELTRRTTLRDSGNSVQTVEHVLSAAAGLEVDDLIVELNAPEPPFLDGSALPYAKLLRAANIIETDTPLDNEIVVRNPITFVEGDCEFSAIPSDTFRVTFFYDSGPPHNLNQSASFPISPSLYIDNIAPARTFCFFDEIEAMRKAKLIKGANLASAVVIGKKGLLNNELRFTDEPVRHKILDLIGDLALLGSPLRAHVIAWRTGHRANALFGMHLRKELGL